MKLLKKENKQDKQLKSRVLYGGVVAGLAQAIYIGLTAIFMNSVQHLGQEPLGGFLPSFLFFLLFFVLSAVISTVLVFGRPIFLLLDKKYKEAVLMLLTTILTLLIILLVVLVVILI